MHSDGLGRLATASERIRLVPICFNDVSCVCSEEFTAVVKLPVKDILNVVCRVLAVTPKMLVGGIGDIEIHYRSVIVLTDL